MVWLFLFASAVGIVPDGMSSYVTNIQIELHDVSNDNFPKLMYNLRGTV